MAVVREEEIAQEKEAVEFYNEQRKQQVIWEQEARAAERAATNNAEKKARKSDALFWRAEREKQRVKEAEMDTILLLDKMDKFFESKLHGKVETGEQAFWVEHQCLHGSIKRRLNIECRKLKEEFDILEYKEESEDSKV